MSLKENKYIRYFGGHDKSVVTLAMNPADDTFLSGSLDKTIRLWDLRSNHCQVATQLSNSSIFWTSICCCRVWWSCLGAQWQLLTQMDWSSLPASTPRQWSSMISGPSTKEPSPLSSLQVMVRFWFAGIALLITISVDTKDNEWTGLKFSPDGKSILISTKGQVIKLIDSYNGTSLQTFTGNTRQHLLLANHINNSLQVISTPSSFRWRLPSLLTPNLSSPAPVTAGSTSGTLRTVRKFVFLTETITTLFSVFRLVGLSCRCWE